MEPEFYSGRVEFTVTLKNLNFKASKNKAASFKASKNKALKDAALNGEALLQERKELIQYT